LSTGAVIHGRIKTAASSVVFPNRQGACAMTGETGGWLWLAMDVVFVLVLAAALAYGIGMWHKRRSRSVERSRDQATRELYHRSSNE